ncbi:hypothetical protein [Nostoc sp. FACHB-190]|uniref:hypothetical protein n=1 Tax=Nostoc sp. FACHB-190 TaxID=2692838 RepID=UPI001685EADA|nr:hypothetical protein [Nostoc sp. FACHB-190]MBD2303176.1 hypothetical protein [Nostoc sp. FACHB-190]
MAKIIHTRFLIPITLLLTSSIQIAYARTRLPSGSYQATCTQVQVVVSSANSSHLQGYCKDRRGYPQIAVLENFDKCRGDIYNLDGFLTCVKGDSDAPSGSYRQSCYDIEVQGNLLYATCKTSSGNPGRNGRGKWIDTTLNNFRLCSKDIANTNGFLRCIR